jgi:trehalose 6-phosphate phosphatase
MTYLFSAAGKTELATLLARPALLAFDFDGTLAPIVDLPQAAQMPVASGQLLQLLCEKAPVAIISGRSIGDLQGRLGGVKPKYLVGNHGLEGINDASSRLAEAQALCAQWRQQLAPLLAHDPAARGVVLEDKTYSLTLHYRLAPDASAAAGWLRSVVAGLDPAPHVIGGKQVLNLMPSRTSNKRQALESLLQQERLTHALYAGDDDTDEAIFADAPLAWLTLRIEPSPLSGARFFLRRQEEVERLLQEIVHLL